MRPDGRTLALLSNNFFLFLFFIILIFKLRVFCMYVGMCIRAIAFMWGSASNRQESVLSLYCVGPGIRIRQHVPLPGEPILCSLVLVFKVSSCCVALASFELASYLSFL